MVPLSVMVPPLMVRAAQIVWRRPHPLQDVPRRWYDQPVGVSVVVP